MNKLLIVVGVSGLLLGGAISSLAASPADVDGWRTVEGSTEFVSETERVDSMENPIADTVMDYELTNKINLERP